MFWEIVGSNEDGWLVVFYTKTATGRARTIFEVSRRYSEKSIAERMGADRLQDLVDAANQVGGSFP